MTRLTMLLLLWMCALAPSAANHVMLSDTLRHSTIYPGTSHAFSVSVPDVYDGAKPAALYVGLDGPLCHAPQVMDSLMACGAMPVTIGIYLQPGVVRDKDGQVLRYNRSNEFDMTDGRFADFLATELLPAVARLTTPDGRALRWSDRAEDHCIAGLSSGGIAAFMAAWWRPDLFGRVFSGVGTFVAMRGGNDVAALVRKSEQRRLRIFLQDGSQDVWNPVFGHWYEGNRLLASALEFAGFDLQTDWSDGGHNVTRATEIFPEVMTWLWADVPQRRPSGNTLLQQLVEGQPTGWSATSVNDFVPRSTDGMAAVYPDGSLAVKSVVGDNNLWQVVRGDDGRWQHAQRFYWLHSVDNHTLAIGPMAFDGDGNLWVVTSMGLQVCDQNGRVRAILDLPRDIDLTRCTGLTIVAGGVVLHLDDGKALQRSLHVTVPEPGLRPTPQGQG